MKKTLFIENLIKNIIVLILLIPAYSSIKAFFFNSVFSTNVSVLGNLLFVVSILIVTACFGNFAFTYEKVEKKSKPSRMLAHLTSGLLMLIIGMSLEMTAAISFLLIGNFFVLNLSFLLLYVASIAYDFWDMARME